MEGVIIYFEEEFKSIQKSQQLPPKRVDFEENQ